MTRLVAPKGVQGIDVNTPRGVAQYSRDKKGFINVEDKKHLRQMKAEGMFEASLMGSTAHNVGFTCNNCGFGSWFKKCSRCGYENERIMKDGD